MVRLLALVVSDLMWCSLLQGSCSARSQKTIEERCLPQEMKDMYHYRECKFKIAKSEASQIKSGACSRDFCVYKLMAIAKNQYGESSKWSGGGFLAAKSPYGYGPGDPLTARHGYKWAMNGSKGKIGLFDQECGAACNFPPEWVSGSFKGAKLSEIGAQLLIRIPRR